MPNEKCPDGLVRFYRRVYSSEKNVKLLKGVDVTAVVCVVLAFAICLYKTFFGSFYDGIMLLLGAAIPFVLVTAMRRIVSAPRPYEVLDFSEIASSNPHGKHGASFPSRHVFSAFLIGTLAVSCAPILGFITLAFGCLLAFARVALGIHFPKDVICGAVIGVVSGLIYILIL